jgi:4-carboxymuconolactone decarboxylase
MHENDAPRRGRDATVELLGAEVAALLRVAAAVPDAAGPALAGMVRAALAAGTGAVWLEELVLSAPLFVGFPRALVAAAALRAEVAQPAGDIGDAADYGAWPAWRERGEKACAAIYGGGYDRLRANVRALHPALDAWIVMDGYGRTLSRPGLPVKLREFCAIAMLVPQRAERQLHSHLRGALNVGAEPAEVDAVLDIVNAMAVVPGSRAAAARRLWLDLGRRG